MSKREVVQCGDVLIDERTGEVHRCLRPFGHEGGHIESAEKNITGVWTWSPESSQRQRDQMGAMQSGQPALIATLDRIARALEQIAGSP